MNSCPFIIEKSWQTELKEELAKPYMSQLAEFIKRERSSGAPVYPPEELVFNAFQQTPFHKVKVVIVGQDPYHGQGQAHGLCFSVPRGVQIPPSLQNIFKELKADLNTPTPAHGCLISWAAQGVLLLNATLTVRDGSPMSHHKKGWELFTDAVIAKVCKKKEPVIFVLWGKSAQKKCLHILSDNDNKHPLLVTSHPSPLSAYQGFLGCRHFSKINELLVLQKKKPIEWALH